MLGRVSGGRSGAGRRCGGSWLGPKPYLLCAVLSRLARPLLLAAIVLLFGIVLIWLPVRSLIVVLFLLCIALAGLLC